MIEIKNLHARVEDKEILKDLSLTIKSGEIHAIMGPNGSGKSTLASVIAGKDEYEVTSGEVFMNGKNILALEPEERAGEGIFLAFQYPVEIPGVSISNFLKTSVNEVRAYNKLEPLSTKEFIQKMKLEASNLKISLDMIKRSMNEGFSGGEKKRNEILQMAMLEPKFAVMDETDSGLDIDALQIVADGVNRLRTKDNAFLIITHYQRLLEHIVPDFVHILYNGKIVKSGDKSLALELEKEGYQWLEKEHA